MVTLFECWNGGTVQWDGVSLPQFVFAFPPESAEAVQFLQLSARICEILTRCEWVLNIGGQAFDVPNLPAIEIQRLVMEIGDRLGYLPVTVPYSLAIPYAGYTTIPVALWVHLDTGRADLFSPPTGLIQGQQLLPPRVRPGEQVPVGALQEAVTPQGTFLAGSGQGLLDSLSTMAGESSGIYDFLSSGETSIDYSAWEPEPDDDPYVYDLGRQFEEDSAGWPGGAYQNPDSYWYRPDLYGDP